MCGIHVRACVRVCVRDRQHRGEFRSFISRTNHMASRLPPQRHPMDRRTDGQAGGQTGGLRGGLVGGQTRVYVRTCVS